MTKNQSGQSLVEFVLSLNLTLTMTAFVSACLGPLLIGQFLKADLYELARVRVYGVEAPCHASKHWPKTLFEIQVFCDDKIDLYAAKLRFKLFEGSNWHLKEEIQLR